jgi:hypothetical protein
MKDEYGRDRRDRLAEEWLKARHGKDWYIGAATTKEWRAAYDTIDDILRPQTSAGPLANEEATVPRVLDLGPSPTRAVSINEVVSRHWRSTHDAKVTWRDTVCWLAKEQRLAARVAGRPCVIRFTIPVPDRRHRDPHNYVGSVVKWAIDGLVLAGCWPSDRPEFVSVLEPRLVVGGHLLLELWERQGDETWRPS